MTNGPPVANGVVIQGKLWVIEHPEELFEVVDRDVMKNDWVRSKGSMGSVIIGVSIVFLV